MQTRRCGGRGPAFVRLRRTTAGTASRAAELRRSVVGSGPKGLLVLNVKRSPEILVFGAGNIGRGLLGELAARAGRPVAFVEANIALAKQLVMAGGYRVRLAGQEPSVCEITNYRVLTPNDRETIAEAVAQCDFAATAVGGENLAAVACLLRDGIEKRTRPLNILVCENWPNGEQVLASALSEQHVSPERYSCVPCSVARMVRSDGDSLNLVGESGESLLVDASRWKGDPPGIEGMIACDNLAPFYARKLYTSNAGHAVLAYHGFLAGYRFLYQALNDEAILKQLTDSLTVAVAVLVREHAMDRGHLEEHVAHLLKYRFASIDLADTVTRVARQPLRKLGPKERLVGLMRLLEKHDMSPQPVLRTIAAALHYYDPADSECRQMRKMISTGGPGQVLAEICGMDRGERCFDQCLLLYDEITDQRKGKREE